VAASSFLMIGVIVMEGEKKVEWSKKEVITNYLDSYPSVLIQFDARCVGVSVPPQMSNDHRLVFRLGYGLTPPILDLFTDNGGISVTLHFAGRPFSCVIPWGAVYRVSAENLPDFYFWEDSMPTKIMDTPVPEPVDSEDTAVLKIPHLKLVD